MNHHKRSSLALSAVALAVVASIVACATPSQVTQPLPPTLALPTSLPAVTLAPPDTSTPVPTDTVAPTQTALVWTATPLPTSTSTPFSVVVVPPPPPAYGITFSNVTRSTTVLYDDGPCSPISVAFSVVVTPLGSFNHVDLYTGLPWFGSPYERWDDGTTMVNGTGSTYFYKSITHSYINAHDLKFATPEPHPIFDAAPLSYQFVAMDAYGNVVARSRVYSDITYYMCK
ncbi:MAG: hypothetical protein ABSB61_06655 [Anaerolineales bacterium]|jgi:hypothetical protein